MTLEYEFDQKMIDRLIDGEVAEAEWRATLSEMDQRPDSWRQLALGFLESQSWNSVIRESLTSPAARPAELPAEPAVVPEVTPPAARRRKTALQIIVYCVGITAIFAIGLFSGDRWQEWRGNNAQLAQGDQSFSEHQRFLSEIQNQHEVPKIACDTINIPPTDSSDGMRPLELPVVAIPRGTPQILTRQGPVIGPEIRARLQKLGYIVSEERRVYPVILDDGRRVLVPVNDVKVRFVGDRVYK